MTAIAYQVRFVQSEVDAIINLLRNLPALIQQFKETTQADLDACRPHEDDPEEPITRGTLDHWLDELHGFDFLSTCLAMLDVYSIQLRFSLATQSDGLLVIHYPGLVEDNINRLEDFASGKLGPIVLGHLDDLAKQRFSFKVSTVRHYKKHLPPPVPSIRVTGCPSPGTLRRSFCAFQRKFAQNLVFEAKEQLQVYALVT